MSVIKIALPCLAILYLLSLGILSMMSTRNLEVNQQYTSSENSKFRTVTEPEAPKVQAETIKFSNPALAYKVLGELDVFKPANHSYYAKEKSYTTPFLGLRNDKDYCEKHREYIVNHPESIFEEMNIVFDWSNRSLPRTKVLSEIGTDIQPHISNRMPEENKKRNLYELKPFTTSFFTINRLYANRRIGTHFSCLSQASNHIPGSTVLGRKDYVAEAASAYMKKYESRPQCLNNEKVFPKTWLLYRKEECQEFFNIFNSAEYKAVKEERKIVYIRKVGAGAHRGAGVHPVNDEEETKIRLAYDNGKKCGINLSNNIMQTYVHNPLLINGKKFDFRMYLLVASTNPLMAYYHDGFLRVSLIDYDANSSDKKVLLTNLALSQQIHDDAKEGKLFEGMDPETLKIAQQWDFARLQAYLLEAGVISDPNWLDNYLRPEFKKAMIHLLRLSSSSFLTSSSLYELYGVDYMLDEDLNLWFIEANSSPVFDGYSQPMEKIITKMLKNHFEVIHSLLRSRMMRVTKFVNRIVDSNQASVDSNGKVVIQDLIYNRFVFQEITKNSMEKEFELASDNGFSKIIDENFTGVERYQGLIRQECL